MFEVIVLQVAVALRERSRTGALLNSLLREASEEENLFKPDARNLRTFRQLVLAQVVAGQRRVGSVKSASMALG